MAKRLTDTDKWKKVWYRELGSIYRDIWQYLLDNCNHAGIWEVDLDTLAHFTGNRVTVQEMVEKFGSRIVVLPDNKIFVRAFFEFQYSKAKEGFKARLSALEELKKYNLVDENGTLREQLPNSPITVGGQLPNCLSISISTSTSNSTGKEGGLGETAPTSPLPPPVSDAQRFENAMRFDFETLWGLYPRPQKKTHAMNHFRTVISTREAYDEWERAIKNYAKHCRDEGLELKFILTFPNFVAEWTDWRDWKSKSAKSAEAIADELIREYEERNGGAA